MSPPFMDWISVDIGIPRSNESSCAKALAVGSSQYRLQGRPAAWHMAVALDVAVFRALVDNPALDGVGYQIKVLLQVVSPVRYDHAALDNLSCSCKTTLVKGSRSRKSWSGFRFEGQFPWRWGCPSAYGGAARASCESASAHGPIEHATHLIRQCNSCARAAVIRQKII
jgi:hypothetical protein